MQSFPIKVLSAAGLLALLAGAAAGDGVCTGIEVRAGTSIFTDGFASGDLSAWGGASRFRATRILDLDLETRFAADFSGDHVLHLRLLTPKGHHYQTLTAPITAGATGVAAGGMRRVAGYPRPLAVLRAQPAAAAGETSVTLQLPVAGTAIVSHALYGAWTVTATLDDQTEPCGPAAGFFLAP